MMCFYTTHDTRTCTTYHMTHVQRTTELTGLTTRALLKTQNLLKGIKQLHNWITFWDIDSIRMQVENNTTRNQPLLAVSLLLYWCEQSGGRWSLKPGSNQLEWLCHCHAVQWGRGQRPGGNVSMQAEHIVQDNLRIYMCSDFPWDTELQKVG